MAKNTVGGNVDLNRNFPSYFHNNSRLINKDVIESNAIKNWMENNTFILSASLHSGSVIAIYPFDILEYPSKYFNTFLPLVIFHLSPVICHL